MSYQSWHESHSKKHQEIVARLSHLSDDEVIEYFDFENMKVKEKDFCVLYAKNKKCHDIENLNCYLCACPNFRVAKDSSFCDINSKDGGTIEGKDGFIHQDCSACLVPHRAKYVKKNFDRSWEKIMSKTFVENI
jgi:Zn-finger protein